MPQNNGGHIQFGRDVEGTRVFEYGTTWVEYQDGSSYTALAGSGRRLTVVGIADTLREALARVEQRIGDDRTGIRFPGMDRRTDTGCNRDLPKEWLDLYA
jgi:phosphoribosylamine-glycine ligase